MVRLGGASQASSLEDPRKTSGESDAKNEHSGESHGVVDEGEEDTERPMPQDIKDGQDDGTGAGGAASEDVEKLSKPDDMANSIASRS